MKHSVAWKWGRAALFGILTGLSMGSLRADFFQLAYPTATSTTAYGISGDYVVGAYEAPGTGGFTRSFLYQISTNQYFNLLPPGTTAGVLATGISGNMVVGAYSLNGSGQTGFTYNITTNTYTDVSSVLALTGLSGSTMVGYNDAGGSNYSAFSTTDGVSLTPIPGPPGTQTIFANGISGSKIVGNYSQNGNDFYAFVYDGSSYFILDVTDPDAYPGSTNAYGTDGTNTVGYYYNNSGNPVGFIYDGADYRNFMIPGSLGTYVFGTDGTSIVGNYYTDTESFGFIAPIPEPGTIALLGLGGVLFLFRPRRTA